MTVKVNNYDVIIGHRVTEKSSRCAQKGQYVFTVRKDATKTSIKKAVKAIFNADVKSCQVANRPGKEKTRVNGRTKDFKVAYITLKDDQQLNTAE